MRIMVIVGCVVPDDGHRNQYRQLESQKVSVAFCEENMACADFDEKMR
jgi:hypothetical protein